MTGTQVFDRLSLDEKHSVQRSSGAPMLPHLAEQMVSASLTSGRMLRELRDRMFPSQPDPGAIEVAQTLREEFTAWVADAEAAYRRAQQVERRGQKVSGADELGDLIGATRAMLQITLEAHLRSLNHSAGPHVVPIEDLRRELQLKRGA